jgi:hypothetical protein
MHPDLKALHVATAADVKASHASWSDALPRGAGALLELAQAEAIAGGDIGGVRRAGALVAEADMPPASWRATWDRIGRVRAAHHDLISSAKKHGRRMQQPPGKPPPNKAGQRTALAGGFGLAMTILGGLFNGRT